MIWRRSNRMLSLSKAPAPVPIAGQLIRYDRSEMIVELGSGILSKNNAAGPALDSGTQIQSGQPLQVRLSFPPPAFAISALAFAASLEQFCPGDATRERKIRSQLNGLRTVS